MISYVVTYEWLIIVKCELWPVVICYIRLNLGNKRGLESLLTSEFDSRTKPTYCTGLKKHM